MNLLTTKQFAAICGVSYEAIRQRIKAGSIVPIARDPIVIDADEYRGLIEYIQTRAKRLTITKP